METLAHVAAYRDAVAYISAGLSVVPIKRDGSKGPAVPWKDFTDRLATLEELARWFDSAKPFGIAITGGRVSGNAELIDFDDGSLFAPWRAAVEAERPGLVDSLCQVKTPRPGIHTWYRCSTATIPGNTKLAVDGGKTLIETRGQGGYALVPGSPAECHETGRLYEHIAGPTFSALADITSEERELLLNTAKLFDKSKIVEWKAPKQSTSGELRPGDDYCRRGPSWSEILEPHGWRCIGGGDVKCWKRPGKTSMGWSATTGHCKNKEGYDFLYVFSSNAQPFNAQNGKSCFTKFQAFTLLECNGDFKEATRRLAVLGYGEQRGVNATRLKRDEKPDDTIGGFKPPTPVIGGAFPMEAFPPALQGFMGEIAKMLDCPVDFAAVPMIVVAGSVLGNSRALQIKRGWYESGRFYAAIVAHPGSAKSPAEKIVKYPLMKMQIAESESWKDRVETWEAMKQQYENALKRSMPVGAMPSKPGQAPFEPHLFTTDATVEALAPMLQANPRGISFLSDEFLAWLGGMNQYKGGAGRDRQFWLSGWSGEPWKVDRKGQTGSIIIPRPFVNVLGGIQPDKIKMLTDAEQGNDGLIDRVLFSYPVVRHGGSWKECDLSEAAEKFWSDLVSWLHKREMIEDGKSHRPKFVSFTPLARQCWEKWYNEHQKEVEVEGFPEDLIGIWSKLRAYCARLALTLHYLRLGCYELTGEVDDDSEPIGEAVGLRSMFSAWLMIDYFKSHLKRVRNRMEVTAQDVKVGKIYAWLEKQKDRRCSDRDLIRVKFCKKASEARQIIMTMYDLGYVKIIWKDAQSETVRGMECWPEDVAKGG